MDQAIEEKLERLQKEYAQKKRKLKKIKRAAKAKAHVKMKLLEQECLTSQKESLLTKDETVATGSQKSPPTEYTAVVDTPKEKCLGLAVAPVPDNVLTDPESKSSTEGEIDKLEGAPEVTAITPGMKGIRQTPSSWCELFTPHSDSDTCDKQTCKPAKPNRKHSESCEKMAKYRNRKIVTKLNTSNPPGNKTRQGLEHGSTAQTDSDTDNTTVAESHMSGHSADVNGNLTSAKPTSNIECEMDAMIYERKPDLPMFVKKECFTSDQSECNNKSVENVSKIRDTTGDLSMEDIRTKERNSENGLCKSPTQHFEILERDGINSNGSERIASKVVALNQEGNYSTTESSQNSSVYSEDIFDNEENSLKRRTRKAKRRSVSSGRQRHSSRIAELSSQDTSTSTPQNDVRFYPNVSRGEILGKVNKTVIISSVFQCLVDEVKRKKANDFNIPNEYLSLKYIEVETKSGVVKPLNSDMRKPIADIDTPSTSQPSISTDSNNTGSFCPVLSSLSTPSKTGAETEAVDTGTLTDRFGSLAFPDVGVGEAEDLDNTGNQSPTLSGNQSPTLSGNQSPTLSGNQSPTLFDSQTVVTTLGEVKEPDMADGSVTDPGIVELSTGPEVKLNAGTECNNSQCRDQSEKKLGGTKAIEHEAETEEVHLEQIASFQVHVPQTDQLLAMEAVMAVRCGEPAEFVVCLCTSALKLYSHVDSDWTCVGTQTHSSPIRKNFVYHLYGWSGYPSVSLVLRLSRSDCTTLTHYTYSDSCIKQNQVDSVTSKGVCSCSPADHQLIVSTWTGQKSKLTKYTLDTSTGHWSQFELETCDHKIVTMATIKQIGMAIAGFTSRGFLLIWNHLCGFLLSTVDLSDICPRDFLCPGVFQEQGYLFLPLLTKRKCLEPGSIVVVNPLLNTSEALTSIQAGDQTWTGCSKASVFGEDLLVTRETSGRLSVLDLFSGSCLATIDDISVTCIASSNDILCLAHKQCVHIYTLKS